MERSTPAHAIAAPPPLDLTLADPSATQEWTEKTGRVSLLPGHVRLPSGSAVMELQGFDEGAWWVQDLAASIPARLLGEGKGHVLDLCAAPGARRFQLPPPAGPSPRSTSPSRASPA